MNLLHVKQADALFHLVGDEDETAEPTVYIIGPIKVTDQFLNILIGRADKIIDKNKTILGYPVLEDRCHPCNHLEIKHVSQEERQEAYATPGNQVGIHKRLFQDILRP